MQKRVRTGQQYGAGQEEIDLFSMMDDALRCFQKYWLQFLLLIVIVTAVFIIYGNRQYVPQYQAKVTYAVNKTGDSDTDASIAQRLSNSISVVTKTGDFKDRLFADVEEENVNPNYVISSAYTDNSNLFSVTGDGKQLITCQYAAGSSGEYVSGMGGRIQWYD